MFDPMSRGLYTLAFGTVAGFPTPQPVYNANNVLTHYELTVYAKDLAEEDPEESKAHFELGYYWLSKANIQKHPAATLELAGYFRRGDVIEKDVAKSVSLVKQAAEWGEVQAMRDLAFIYENGLGIEIDEEKADYWTEKAQAAEK